MLAVSDRHGNRVDLLGGLRGLDPDAFTRAISVPFQGESVRIIGREDFIAMKCYAGSPQDLADALSALTTLDERVDIDMLRRITRRFGRAAADAPEQLLSG
jgi:predicted nucleotidyltransferase